MDDTGPIYGVELIDSLPIGTGSMRQAMPSRSDLEQARKCGASNRVCAGYEVLLDHYRLAYEVRKDAERQAEGWRLDCIAARDQRDAARAEVERLRERERKCPTMHEAESRSLLRALQEIAAHLGLPVDRSSPAQIVDAVRASPPNPERSGSEADRSRELLGDQNKENKS